MLVKRAFDICFSILLIILLFPLMLFIVLIVFLMSGRPVFYLSERMNGICSSFTLLKFRTMTNDVDDSGVSGGDKISRITREGAFLRSTRLDELPQLFNILRGQMSFVGPRPPLKQYVNIKPDIYAEVLGVPPGVTGLASLMFHKHEEKLLSRAKSKSETDFLYVNYCIPRKAKLDIIYKDNRSLCFDLKILIMTIVKVAVNRGK